MFTSSKLNCALMKGTSTLVKCATTEMICHLLSDISSCFLPAPQLAIEE